MGGDKGAREHAHGKVCVRGPGRGRARGGGGGRGGGTASAASSACRRSWNWSTSPTPSANSSSSAARSRSSLALTSAAIPAPPPSPPASRPPPPRRSSLPPPSSAAPRPACARAHSKSRRLPEPCQPPALAAGAGGPTQRRLHGRIQRMRAPPARPAPAGAPSAALRPRGRTLQRARLALRGRPALQVGRRAAAHDLRHAVLVLPARTRARLAARARGGPRAASALCVCKPARRHHPGRRGAPARRRLRLPGRRTGTECAAGKRRARATLATRARARRRGQGAAPAEEVERAEQVDERGGRLAAQREPRLARERGVHKAQLDGREAALAALLLDRLQPRQVLQLPRLAYLRTRARSPSARLPPAQGAPRAWRALAPRPRLRPRCQSGPCGGGLGGGLRAW